MSNEITGTSTQSGNTQVHTEEQQSNINQQGTSSNESGEGTDSSGANEAFAVSLSDVGLGHDAETEHGTTYSKEEIKAQLQARLLEEPELEKMIDEFVDATDEVGIVSINAIKVFNQTPKAFDKIAAHVAKRSGNKVDFELLLGTLLYAPTVALFKVFDEEKVFINIVGYEGNWYYTINNSDLSEVFASRELAEKHAFTKGFEILENNLA